MVKQTSFDETASVYGVSTDELNKLQALSRGGGNSFSADWAREMRRVADGGLTGASLEAINFRLGVEVDEKTQRIVELERQLEARCEDLRKLRYEYGKLESLHAGPVAVVGPEGERQ